MKEVSIVFGRTESITLDPTELTFDTDGLRVYSVHESFDSAVAEFKKLIMRSRKAFFKQPPLVIADEWIKRIKKADPYAEFYPEEDSNVGECDLIGWDYTCKNKNASWIMRSKTYVTCETVLLPQIHVVKKEVKA